MAFGQFTEDMRQALIPYVRGRTVWDLGAGDLSHSRMLVKMGAHEVIAIDKARMPSSRRRSSRITTQRCYFNQVTTPIPPIELSLLSWPEYVDDSLSTNDGLIPILQQSKHVIYMGSNTDGTVCGSSALVRHFLRRRVLAHISERHNTMLLYGPCDADVWRADTELYGEEFASLATVFASQYLTYEQTLRPPMGLVEWQQKIRPFLVPIDLKCSPQP